jgi:serine/threonine-protein kinase RsbW
MAEPEQTPGSPGPDVVFGSPGPWAMTHAPESAGVAGLPDVLAAAGPLAGDPGGVAFGTGGATGWDGHGPHEPVGGEAPEAVARSGDDDVIELTVPALSGYLSVVRTATAGLAARLSFTLDEIEDLRIAVDEACAMLLTLPGPPIEPPTLTCRFRVLTDGLAVSVSAARSADAVLPAEQSFAWHVLTAHAAEVSGRAKDGQAVIDLVKRRPRR